MKLSELFLNSTINQSVRILDRQMPCIFIKKSDTEFSLQYENSITPVELMHTFTESLKDIEVQEVKE